MKSVMMTQAEIHAFGIRVVASEIREKGFVIEGANADLNTNPQIIARRENLLFFVAVKTACYPGMGLIDSSVHIQLIKHSIAHHALPCLASLGIYNIQGTTDEERGMLFRGGGLAVSYYGVSVLASPDQVREARFFREKNRAMQYACRAHALMLNSMDESKIESLLAEDVTYASQWTGEVFTGKDSFLCYFAEKFKNFRNKKAKIWAELAYTNAFEMTPCVLAAFKRRERLDMTTLLETDTEGMITGMRTGWLPPPYACLRTGEIPVNQIHEVAQ